MRKTLTLFLSFASCFTSALSAEESSAKSRTFTIKSSPKVQYELQARIIESLPGDVIELPAGKFVFQSEINIVSDGLTIRGAGPDRTILSFQNQQAGGAGIEATGNGFTIENLAVEDTSGNAIKVLGANGVVFRNVRTEWTNGADSENGAYGIYPVQCSNVLIDGCTAIGASDAGIYVGQCRNVIVRNSSARQNVAGIEIENTQHADVYDNVATDNAGGLLVFDLPGLQITNGNDVRLYRNKVFENNHRNFAKEGNIVASVPPGCGLMIMATDRVEVFENEFRDNQTANTIIVGFDITGRKRNDKKYDAFPESISIHNNVYSGGGNKPSGQIGMLLATVLGTQFPDILYDGVLDAKKKQDGKLPDELQLRLADNDDATFANFRFDKLSPSNIFSGKYKVERETTAYSGRHTALSAVTLEKPKDFGGRTHATVALYRSMPQRLSEWNLFAGSPVDQKPAQGVVKYDLISPLFSDYTTKHRFVRLPEGQSAEFHPTDTFNFPVGTTIAKTFAYDDHSGGAVKSQLLETRIELRKETGWYGFSYIWNADQTDATLSLGGGELHAQWTDSAGEAHQNTYRIPNANQCLSCHSQKKQFQPIGPKARHLNHSFAYANGKQNQLTHWIANGLLKGAPKTDTIATIADYDDAHDSLNDRARAWLEINCAHCHNPVGSARTSGLDLSLAQSDLSQVGVWKIPVATGRASGGNKYDIVPGKPDESILMYRIESDAPGVRMPSVAREIVHSEGIELIRKWIQQLPDPNKKTAAKNSAVR